MTPQERQMLDQLFDRLATLEKAPRDPGAMRAISEGLARAPGAIYPLVQSVLVQDEALKRADARIRELESELGVESGQPPQQTGFLDNMRDALFGKSQGSVPTVRQGGSPWGSSVTNAGAPPVQPPGYAQPGYAQPGYAQPGMGGSFLGTAAASAAGVIGGALLMNSFRGMFGGHQSQAFGDTQSTDRGAPRGGSASGSDLARDAGLDDIGGRRTAALDDDNSQRAGLFDVADNDVGDDSDDGGGFDAGGDSDTA